MKRLTEYISELLHSQIDPNMCRDLADVRPPVDKQSITSKNDIIHVEFEYKDKIYKYDIKYNDLDFGTSENIHWHTRQRAGHLLRNLAVQQVSRRRY